MTTSDFNYGAVFLTPGTAEHFLSKLEELAGEDITRGAVKIFKFNGSTVEELMTYVEYHGGVELSNFVLGYFGGGAVLELPRLLYSTEYTLGTTLGKSSTWAVPASSMFPAVERDEFGRWIPSERT
jgi:hypothetical protein